jgi:hypothetical protein
MAQINTNREKIANDGGSLIGIYNENEGVATTCAFTDGLDVDARAIRESVLVIHNKTTGDLDWRVLANARPLSSIVAPTGTNDDDEGWVVIQTGSIATTVAPTVVTFSNPWTKFIVQVKHTTLTTNVDIWHRGEN